MVSTSGAVSRGGVRARLAPLLLLLCLLLVVRRAAGQVPGKTKPLLVPRLDHPVNGTGCPQECLQRGNCTAARDCECAAPWTGPFCETEFCTPLCLNDGSCVDGECVCVEGFAGDACEHEILLPKPDLLTVLGFAVIVLASWQVGAAARFLNLPLITGYIGVGVLAGPHILNLIPEEQIRKLDFVDHVALAFIAFAAGGKLYFKELVGKGRAIACVTASLVCIEYIFATSTVFAMSSRIQFMADMAGGSRFAISMLIGTLMVARSPASALAIVRELNASGPFTTLCVGVTVVMDMTVIVLFSINVLVASSVISVKDKEVSPGWEFGKAMLRLIISGIGGVGLGFVAPYIIWDWARFIVPRTRLHLQLITGVQLTLFVLLGFAVFILETLFDAFFDPLLLCMVTGLVFTNYGRVGTRENFLHALHILSPYVYVAFFTLTGSALQLNRIQTTILLSIFLFFLRAVGIVSGAWLGGRFAGESENYNRVAWMAYMTQAGVALGLAKKIHSLYPVWGGDFATVIVTVVIINQGIGPPLFKAVIRHVKEAGANQVGKGTCLLISDCARPPSRPPPGGSDDDDGDNGKSKKATEKPAKRTTTAGAEMLQQLATMRRIMREMEWKVNVVEPQSLMRPLAAGGEDSTHPDGTGAPRKRRSFLSRDKRAGSAAGQERVVSASRLYEHLRDTKATGDHARDAFAPLQAVCIACMGESDDVVSNLAWMVRHRHPAMKLIVLLPRGSTLLQMPADRRRLSEKKCSPPKAFAAADEATRDVANKVTERLAPAGATASDDPAPVEAVGDGSPLRFVRKAVRRGSEILSSAMSSPVGRAVAGAAEKKATAALHGAMMAARPLPVDCMMVKPESGLAYLLVEAVMQAQLSSLLQYKTTGIHPQAAAALAAVAGGVDPSLVAVVVDGADDAAAAADDRVDEDNDNADGSDDNASITASAQAAVASKAEKKLKKKVRAYADESRTGKAVTAAAGAVELAERVAAGDADTGAAREGGVAADSDGTGDASDADGHASSDDGARVSDGGDSGSADGGE